MKDPTVDELRGSKRSSRYNRSFYLDQADISSLSARVIVPLLVAAVSPTSVVDVGCGLGTWLEGFRDLGVDDVVGIDGSGGRTDLLRIPRSQFIEQDLTQPLDLGRSFDLAMSLEVAEHLPPEYASQFVLSLVSLAPVVVFSAAVPGQGGTGHLNEQWPSYWAERFACHGYEPFDIVRPFVWNDGLVAAHYSQNIIVFANPEFIRSDSAPWHGSDPRIIDVVHPVIFRRKTTHPILVALAQHLPDRVKNLITSQLRRTRFFNRL